VQIDYPVNPEMNVFYQYGAPSTGNQSGRLIAQQDASGMQTFEYGNMGELIKNIHTFVVPAGEAYTFETNWQYDSWNRLVSMQYPDGETVFYEYDNGGKLNQMTGEKNNIQYSYIDNVKYDHFESRTQIEYGNGTYAEYTYHPQNRRLTNLKSYEMSSLLMQDIDYFYDNAGNIIEVDNNGDYVAGNTGGQYSYVFNYDDLYRLNVASGVFIDNSYGQLGYTLNMTYSPSGNILNKELSAQTLINGNQVNVGYNNSYTYPARPHVVDYVGNTQHVWDDNGNMIQRLNEAGARYLCWDEENRLTAVRDKSKFPQLSAYLYDAGGERVWKLTGQVGKMKQSGKTMSSSVFFDKTLYASPYLVVTDKEYTKHYYIEGERVCTKTCAERSRSIGGGFWGTAPFNPWDNALSFLEGDKSALSALLPEMIQRNIECADYDGHWEIDPMLPPVHNKTNFPEYNQYFYHSDHLGSASFITDATGYVDQHIQYLPFGELFISQRNSTFDSRYKFTAKELDNETNYTYFGARYYDSDVSIWLSVDPASELYPSTSPYMYVRGNPVVLIDPNGMWDDYFVFDENGDFLRIEQNNMPDRLVIENSSTGLRDYYYFSDPETDTQQIRDGIINKAAFVSKTDIKEMLNKKGAFSSSWANFYSESKASGDFDYSYTSIPQKYSEYGASRFPLDIPSSVIFVIEGERTAQNHMNFGNFLWAATGFSIGFGYAELQLGAHFNSLVNSGSNNYSPQWDSKDDQKSIKSGAHYADKNNFRSVNSYGRKGVKR